MDMFGIGIALYIYEAVDLNFVRTRVMLPNACAKTNACAQIYLKDGIN